MTIIVKHLPSQTEYIFLGISGGAGKSLLPTKVLGDFFATSVAVCDQNGEIFCFPSTEIQVVEIDGERPSDILPEILPTQPIPLEIPSPHNPAPAKTDEGLGEEDDDDDWI
ncbi:MAG: hypothetical protein N5P05_001488 [Chroococcopsis gigantea SAG 12.99]|jgi:hypothetical protein|nr:hypothetical protein [Chroococcopsis gigantea SAG 12.99]